MRVATILSIAALLCAFEARADEGPSELGHAPHLISTALRKLGKGVDKVLKHGSPHGNSAGAPLFQFFAIPTKEAAIHANNTLLHIEQGVSEVSKSIDEYVANVTRKDNATKQSDAHDAELAKGELLKLSHASARVQDASKSRSAPKAAEIARLQKIKEQLNAAIEARKPPPPPPKQPLESGNIHAFEKYLFAPRPGEEPAQKPTAPPPVVAKQNSSQVQKVKKAPASITAKEVANEVMQKQKAALKEQHDKEESIAEVAHNKTLAALKYKKVKMSRKLRGYLRLPTPPPPVKNEEQSEVHVSAGRKHLLAAADILAKMSDTSLEAAPDNSTGKSKPAKPMVKPAPLASKKAATSQLQLSKFWKINKDSTNVWPWVKGGVHMTL